jgi:L-malate glycosyltransferase
VNSKRPAVLLVGDTLKLGGTEGQFVEIACGLNPARWDVRVACIRAEGPLRPRLEAAGIYPSSCSRGSFKSARLGLAIAALARQLRARQVQVVHSFDLYSNVLAIPAARLAGVPAVIASQRDLGDVRSRTQTFANHLALRAATAVLVNAEAIRAKLVSGGVVPSAKITVVRNGVDLTRFCGGARSKPPDSPWVIGTVANLRPEKGIEDFLGAAALIAGAGVKASFVIWGDGPLRGPLELLARQLGVGDATHFAGLTKFAENALKSLDIFVLPPCSNEGFSNALLEAMAMGLPVVATRVGGNVEMIDHDRTGLLVSPGQPEELAGAFIRLIENPRHATQLGEHASNHVRSQYGMPRMLEAVERLYEGVLTRARG